MNRLLRLLPAEEYERIRRELTPVPFKYRDVLQRVGEPVTSVYFPNGGVASLTMTLPDGSLVEATTLGDEGMVGVEAFLSANPISIAETILQVGDATFEKMSVTAFRAHLDNGGALRDIMGRYTQVLLAVSMQAAACNALHDLSSRCARWLLMAHERIQQEEFHLSHEYLAVMLGVQRPSVTVAAGMLQQAGMIRYRHGKVSVIDRDRLQDAACECYEAVRGHFARARLPYPTA
jgi:CRP-like cAMP-binding protein